MNQKESGDTDESSSLKSFNEINSLDETAGQSPSRFFNQINPDLFRISPRPGGFLKLIVPSRSQDFINICNCAESSVSGRSSTFLTNSNISMNGKYSYRQFNKSTDNRPIKALQRSGCGSSTDSFDGPSFLEESMDMLAIAISCVMQLAANLEVSEDCLVWSKAYLQCIKDDEGNLPRNIRGILHVIKEKLADFPKSDKADSDTEKYSKTSIGSSILSRGTAPDLESPQATSTPLSSIPSSNSE